MWVIISDKMRKVLYCGAVLAAFLAGSNAEVETPIIDAIENGTGRWSGTSEVPSINYKNLLILGVVVGLKTLVILKSSLDVGGLLEEADTCLGSVSPVELGVGAVVGVGVGAAAGSEVRVNTTVGSAVGLAVGLGTATTVGCVVRKIVGPGIGTELGTLIGIAVGSGAGTCVGLQSMGYYYDYGFARQIGPSSLDVGGLLEEADYYDYGIARQATPTLGGFAAAVTVGVGVGTSVGSGTGVAAVRTIRSVAGGFGGVSSDPRPGPGLGGRAPTMMPLLSSCPPTECRVRSTVCTLHL